MQPFSKIGQGGRSSKSTSDGTTSARNKDGPGSNHNRRELINFLGKDGKQSLFCTGSVKALDDLEDIITAGFQKLWTPNWGANALLYAIELSLKEQHKGDGKSTPSFDDLRSLLASNEYRQTVEWLMRVRNLDESAGDELYFSTNGYSAESAAVLLHLVGKQLGEVYQLGTCEDLHDGQNDVRVCLHGGFCGVGPTKIVWLHCDSESALRSLKDGQPVRGLNHWSAIGPCRQGDVSHLPAFSGFLADGIEHSVVSSPTPAYASRKRAATHEPEESSASNPKKPRCRADDAKSYSFRGPINSDKRKHSRAGRVLHGTRSSVRLSNLRNRVNHTARFELPCGSQKRSLDVDTKHSDRDPEGANGEDSDFLSDPPSSDQNEDTSDSDSDEDVSDADDEAETNSDDGEDDDANSDSGSEGTDSEDSDFLSDPPSSDEDENEQDVWTREYGLTNKRSSYAGKDAYATLNRHDIPMRRTKEGTQTYSYRNGVLGAPPVDTDLPYELMSEITDLELLTFFPNHAVHWPAITARLMADGWTYANIANYVNKLRNPGGKKARKVVNANTVLHSIRNGCKQFTGDEKWTPKTPKTRSACPIDTYSTTKWEPLVRQRCHMMLRPAWTLNQIGEGLSRLSGHIPEIGKFSDLVTSALEDPGQTIETVSDRRRQSFNPPRLPPGWHPSTEVRSLVAVSTERKMVEVIKIAKDKSISSNCTPAQPAKKKEAVEIVRVAKDKPISSKCTPADPAKKKEVVEVVKVAKDKPISSNCITTEPAKLSSRRQLHDRQTLHASIKDNPDAIINHLPDVARGETLLWLLSRNGGRKQVFDIAKQQYANAEAAARAGEIVVSEHNIRSTLSHRKKSALKGRAKRNGTAYEQEFRDFEQELYKPRLSYPRKLRTDTKRTKSITDQNQENEHCQQADVITYDNWSQYGLVDTSELQQPSIALQQDIPIDPMLLLPTTFATLSPQLTTWPEYLPAQNESGWSYCQPETLPSVGTDITKLREPDNFNELLDESENAWEFNEWQDRYFAEYGKNSWYG